MPLDTKSPSGPDQEAPKRLSRKELARQLRHEAYLRAKEYRRTDPRQIALRDQQKEQRREEYQKTKERNKEYRDNIKKAEKEKETKTRIVKREDLKSMVVRGSSIKRNHQSGS